MSKPSRLLMLLVAGIIFTACGEAPVGSAAGGSVENNEWVVEGVSPDGRHLLVSTLFGGVASGCTQFEGWTTTELDQTVEITARLWRRSKPSSCTSEGVTEHLQLNLDEPLGERALLGCGNDDCRATVSGTGNGFFGHVVATGTAVAVAGGSGLDVYADTGEFQTTFSGWSSGEVLAIGGDVVVRNSEAEVVALDLVAGDELWRTAGWATAADNDVVYVCRGQDSDGLTAVDAATGNDFWATDLACGSLVPHHELLTIIGSDRNVDGGHRLIVVDATTGSVISDEPFQDGYDDRVDAFDGAIRIGSRTVVSGPQANLVVLANDGTELIRETRGLGYRPLGEADGIAVIGDERRAIGYDPVAGSELWTAFGTISVADGSVWSLDRANGTVSRLNADTGEPLWTTAIGLTASFDVAADEDIAYIVTTQALIAVDTSSGEIQWSRHRPYSEQ